MSKHDDGLILFADDDPVLCTAIEKYLCSFGFRVVVSTDGAQALDLFRLHRPQLVIADLFMPVMTGIEFLEQVRLEDTVTPFIITTGFPEVETAIRAIQNGAYDYLVKPFQLELLSQKIHQALRTNRLVRENSLLTELASLHEITGKLANTHDLDSLLNETFQYCLDVSRAECGSIQLVDHARKSLVVACRKGIDSPSDCSDLNNEAEWPVAKWVVKHQKPLLIANGKMVPDVNFPIRIDDNSSALLVPLCVEREVLGLIHLKRPANAEPFSQVDLNIVEVLASQASIAINNAHLYTSINQKLKELSLVSTYSEQLMGLMDKSEIISCLFNTVQENLAIDVLGFLVIQKRQHQLLHWSRGTISQEYLDSMRQSLIEYVNSSAGTRITVKQVLYKPLTLGAENGGSVALPAAFSAILAARVEDVTYGAVYFGAKAEPENREEKIGLLSSLLNQTRIALTNSKLYGDMKENYIRTIKALAIAVDAKDTYTHGHSESVMNIAEEIAREMEVDTKGIGIIRDAGLLHDIGKIGIPGYILNKPGPLTYEEFNGIMKTHSTLGANIVKDVPFLQDLYSLILHHHEHFDGTGYPDGLKGDDIPIGARILHVADAFEAMTSNRPYRVSLGRKEAIKRLKEDRCKQFDPAVVDAMLIVAGKKGWLLDGDLN